LIVNDGGALESFSSAHAGWLTTVELWSGTKKELVARDAPLRWVRRDATGIEVAVGDSSHLVETHVEGPLECLFDLDEVGAHRGLTIRSSDGTVARLSFRVAAHPEQIDGVMDR
jgi:hypothetical protein